MRKIHVYILLLIVCLILPGCGGGGKINDESTSGTDALTTASAEQVSLLDSGGSPVYRIVRPEDASDTVKNAAVNLRLSLNTLTGATFTISTDFLNKNKNETADGIYEILVGGTNREESSQVSAGLEAFGYVIAVTGTKIVIAGGSDYATAKAAEAFAELFTAGKPFVLAADFRLEDKADGTDHLIGVANQGNSSIEVYATDAGVLNDSTRVWSVKMPYYNIAGLKLRNHDTYGEVVIAVCGNSYASMITYPAGKTVWSTNYAANNPHSIELIPGNIIAVASSTGSALRFFDLDGSPDKYTEVKYDDAHGVLWDPENQVLWALGRNMLKAYTVSKNSSGVIEVSEVSERRSSVPSDYGHDLMPVYGDKNQLWITSGSQVYRYDKTAKSFTTVFDGSDTIVHDSVKSIGNFYDGSLVLTTPDGAFKSWTTATVNYYLRNGTKFELTKAKSETGAFYKCRVWYADYQ